MVTTSLHQQSEGKGEGDTAIYLHIKHITSPHLEGLAKPHLDICIKQAQQGLTQDRSLKPPGFLPVTLD